MNGRGEERRQIGGFQSMGRLRRRSWVSLALAVLAVIGLASAWRRATSEVPAAPANPTEQEAVREGGAEAERSALGPEPDDPQASGPGTRVDDPPRRLSASDTADPCRSIAEPSIPDGYQRLTAQDITVAWPEGEPLMKEPTAFAYLVAGLLEEAALVTGTVRRDRLTVIIYPTIEELRAVPGAPKWASGIYDTAVRVPASKSAPFGVPLHTLRHELMHAQLHAGVGCTPLWFNEGMAMHFAGLPVRREWMSMLGAGQAFEPASLETSTIEEMPKSDVELVYAQSLTMVLFLIDRRAPDVAVREAVSELAGMPRSSRLRLWSKRYPDVGRRELLDFLARRIFKVPRGPELDAIFRGAVCCYGSDVSEFGCRGQPLSPKKESVWFDDSQTPKAMCRTDHLREIRDAAR
jgi:hypothetical protein